MHGDPARAYPYLTGHADEIGTGQGSGSTTNIPLPAGVDDDAYLVALDRALTAVDGFGPDVVVVSLGVDTYVADPMCDLALTTDGFGRMGAAVAALGHRSSSCRRAATPTRPWAPTSPPGSSARPPAELGVPGDPGVGEVAALRTITGLRTGATPP